MDLVLDVVLYLWGKVQVVMQRANMQNPEFKHKYDKVHIYMLLKVINTENG